MLPPSLAQDATSAHPYPGLFIVLEGIDGVGKTTLCANLAAHLEAATGRPVCRLREPGGTDLGNEIRRILLTPSAEERSGAVDLLLFSASRRHLLDTVVRPTLAAGGIVLLDRFVLSTCVYQAAAGVSPDEIAQATQVAVGDCWPDRTFVLTLPFETVMSRLDARGDGARDKFETSAQHAMRARLDAYDHMAAAFPRAVALSAAGTESEVAARAFASLVPLLAHRDMLPTRKPAARTRQGA